jgi:hypothetical protein
LAISIFAGLLLSVVPAVVNAQRGASDPQMERKVRKEFPKTPDAAAVAWIERCASRYPEIAKQSRIDRLATLDIKKPATT